MKQLGASLNAMFDARATAHDEQKLAMKKEQRASYAAFRALCKRKGITYSMARDGYIDLSDGTCLPFYSDWIEALHRLQYPEGSFE